jgi:phage shock protein PspC (stress-responsive transcriptional regulator)
VLAGIGARTGIDPTVLRVAFLIAVVVSGGLALLAYLVAWAAIPDAGDRSAQLVRPGRLLRVRSDWRVAAGVALLTLSALLAFRELGIWWSDALVWPLVLAAFGAALLSRFRATSTVREGGPQAWAGWEPPPPAEAETAGDAVTAARSSSRFADVYGGVFGVLLVIGAALLFLSLNHILGGLRDAALTAVVVVSRWG